MIALSGATAAHAASGPDPAYTGQSAAGERAIAEWNDSNPWQYSTDPIFSLSRGLEENGVTGGARIAALFATVPLDLAQLPAALLAGLWGD
jgi:hypothetical protein